MVKIKLLERRNKLLMKLIIEFDSKYSGSITKASKDLRISRAFLSAYLNSTKEYTLHKMGALETYLHTYFIKNDKASFLFNTSLDEVAAQTLYRYRNEDLLSEKDVFRLAATKNLNKYFNTLVEINRCYIQTWKVLFYKINVTKNLYEDKVSLSDSQKVLYGDILGLLSSQKKIAVDPTLLYGLAVYLGCLIRDELRNISITDRVCSYRNELKRWMKKTGTSMAVVAKELKIGQTKLRVFLISGDELLNLRARDLYRIENYIEKVSPVVD